MASFTYYWQSGDGQVSAEQTPRFVYRMAGIFTWRVDVTDEYGNTANATGTVTVGDPKVARTTRCFVLGFDRRQGIGFYEIVGGDPVMTQVGIIPQIIYDANGYSHLLVYNFKDRYWYDIATYDGPTGSNLTKVWKDKVAADGTGGTAITPEVELAEDVGTYERFFLDLIGMNIYTRPRDKDLAGESGYDSNGYPTGASVTIKHYVDGVETAEVAKMSSVSLPKHEIHADSRVHGNRIKSVLTFDTAEVKLAGVQKTYRSDDALGAPSERESTEDGYQETLAGVAHWVSRGSL